MQNFEPLLASRLIAEQFPQWRHLPITAINSTGTDNALFHLGADRIIRLPRVEWAGGQVDKEQMWLPVLAAQLHSEMSSPLDLPTPLAHGKASSLFPRSWSVYSWLQGQDASVAEFDNLEQTATSLAHFVDRLHKIDPAGGPLAGQHNNYRGVELAQRNTDVVAAIQACPEFIDRAAVSQAWRAMLRVPVWQHPPVWLHGDLHAGNLLNTGGKLSGVIDWGLMGVGDPACDLIVAWNLFSDASRLEFRSAMRVDEATWLRGKGWALSVALIALPYYFDKNPAIVASSRHVIDQVLQAAA